MRLLLLFVVAALSVSTPSLFAQEGLPGQSTILEIPFGRQVELLELRLVSTADHVEGQLEYVTNVPPGDTTAAFMEAWQVVAMAAARLDSLDRRRVAVIFARPARRDATGTVTVSPVEMAFLQDSAGMWRPHRDSRGR